MSIVSIQGLRQQRRLLIRHPLPSFSNILRLLLLILGNILCTGIQHIPLQHKHGIKHDRQDSQPQLQRVSDDGSRVVREKGSEDELC